VEADWPHADYTPAQLAVGNIGIVLGEASGWLVDVDLDAPEARALADAVLPPTLTSGRASSVRSHRWYRAARARTRQFRAPDKSMIVELRAGPGMQTVAPPSIHETGELIEWDANDGRDALALPDAAVELDAAELEECVTRLAVG